MMLTLSSRSILSDSAICPEFSLPNSLSGQVRPAGLGVCLSDRVLVRPQVPSLAPQHNRITVVIIMTMMMTRLPKFSIITGLLYRVCKFSQTYRFFSPTE